MRMINLTGHCPSKNGAPLEWDNLISKIIQNSYSNFHLAGHRNAYVWKTGGNTSRCCTYCVHKELPEGSKYCIALCTDLVFIQTFTEP